MAPHRFSYWPSIDDAIQCFTACTAAAAAAAAAAVAAA